MEGSGREREASTAQLPLLGDGNGDKQVQSAVTPLLLFSIFIAVSGSFAYGSGVGYSSPIESEIMEELGLTTAQFSLFGSILSVGSLVGTLGSGKITDHIGRRGAMGLADALSVVGWIAIAISQWLRTFWPAASSNRIMQNYLIFFYIGQLQEAWSLYVGRFFIGGSIGIVIYVVPVYIAEITPTNLRGQLVSLSTLMASSGVSVMYFAGSVISWRVLVLLGIIPSLVQLLGIFLIPESPRYLAKLGQCKAYESVLQRLRGNNIDISQEAAEIEEFSEQLLHIAEVNFWGLFQRKYAHTLVVVFGLMTLAGFGGPTAVLYYASSVFESAGFSSSIGSIVLAVIQIPGAVISVYLIDKYGRRPLLMFSAGAMGFSCFLVGFMFLLKDNGCLENISPYLIVVGLWGFTAAQPIGMAGIPCLIMSEIFSMNLKGSAGSLSIVVGSLAIWIVAYTFNFATEWSYPGTFFILAWINACTVLFVFKLVPETKGRTLEEIQESLN